MFSPLYEAWCFLWCWIFIWLSHVDLYYFLYMERKLFLMMFWYDGCCCLVFYLKGRESSSKTWGWGENKYMLLIVLYCKVILSLLLMHGLVFFYCCLVALHVFGPYATSDSTTYWCATHDLSWWWIMFMIHGINDDVDIFVVATITYCYIVVTSWFCGWCTYGTWWFLVFLMILLQNLHCLDSGGQMFSGHELAYGLNSGPIIDATFGDLMS